MDAITLELEQSCIVGILARERVEPQILRVALRMELDLTATGESGDLAESVDYGEIDGQIRFLAVHGRFRLIESLALAILRAVLAPPSPGEERAAVQRASVQITKPEVLRIAVPGVELARGPQIVSGERLIAVPEVTAYRRYVPAGAVVSGTAGWLVGRGLVRLPFIAEEPGVVLVVEVDQARSMASP